MFRREMVDFYIYTFHVFGYNYIDKYLKLDLDQLGFTKISKKEYEKLKKRLKPKAYNQYLLQGYGATAMRSVRIEAINEKIYKEMPGTIDLINEHLYNISASIYDLGIDEEEQKIVDQLLNLKADLMAVQQRIKELSGFKNCTTLEQQLTYLINLASDENSPYKSLLNEIVAAKASLISITDIKVIETVIENIIRKMTVCLQNHSRQSIQAEWNNTMDPRLDDYNKRKNNQGKLKDESAKEKVKLKVEPVKEKEKEKVKFESSQEDELNAESLQEDMQLNDELLQEEEQVSDESQQETVKKPLVNKNKVKDESVKVKLKFEPVKEKIKLKFEPVKEKEKIKSESFQGDELNAESLQEEKQLNDELLQEVEQVSDESQQETVKEPSVNKNKVKEEKIEDLSTKKKWESERLFKVKHAEIKETKEIEPKSQVKLNISKFSQD